jgi:hypothetical protein
MSAFPAPAATGFVWFLLLQSATPSQTPLDFAEANRRAALPRWLSLKAIEFDTAGKAPEVPAELRAPALAEGRRGCFVLQLRSPITEADKASVRKAGVELLDYLPNFAFLARAGAAELARASVLPAVKWHSPLHPAWRIDPRLMAAAEPVLPAGLTVHALAGAEEAAAEAQIIATGARVRAAHGDAGRWIFDVDGTVAQARALACGPDLQWVEPAAVMTERNNTTAWVIQTNQSGNPRIWNQGLHGEGQVIGHIDGGISLTSCYFQDPVNPIGPLHRKFVYRNASSTTSHGTHTAGTAAGDSFPINGLTGNRGMAWASRIAHTAGYPFSTYNSVAGTHASFGARLHTNSWGNDNTTGYDTACNLIDLFQHQNEDNLVRFAVTNTSLLKNPENAKNLLAVGASQNGASAGSFCSGGAGPTADGRRKPEVFAPGCSIVSANSSACGTSTLTGTSMACPAVTGAGALVRQYFTEGFHPTGARVPADAFTPTGALIKATLINGGQDLTGIAGYPSNGEGWGRIHLDDSLYFAGDPARLWVVDIRNQDGLSTSDQLSFRVTVLAGTPPLKITLAWCDAPGTVNASNPVVNNLDLSVTSPGSQTFLGNVFAAGNSAPGGTADLKNNVERVVVQSPAAGEWTVTVRGQNVAVGRQGFAIAMSGNLQACFTLAANLPYGTGKAGSFGVPVLASGTLPHVPSTWTLTLSNTLPNAPGLLLFGLLPDATPFDGGTLLVAPLEILPIATDASGQFRLTLPLPDEPFLCGLSTRWQSWIPNDPAASGLRWAASNGLQMRMGN